MKTIQFTDAWGYSHKCIIEVGKYCTGKGTSLQFLEYDEECGDWFPYATATVNLEKLEEGYVYLDTNNFPQVEEIFRTYKFGTYAKKDKVSGYCVYPMYKLNLKKIEEYTG